MFFYSPQWNTGSNNNTQTLIAPGQIWKYKEEDGIAPNLNNRLTIRLQDNSGDWWAEGNIKNSTRDDGLWWIGDAVRIIKNMSYVGREIKAKKSFKYLTKLKCKNCGFTGAYHSLGGFEDECLNTACQLYSIKWEKDSGL